MQRATSLLDSGGNETIISAALCALRSALCLLLLLPTACGAQGLPLESIRLPPGFEIQVFADDLPSARAMVLSPSGTLFVGSREGNVYAVKDSDGDNRADAKFIIARDLNMPVGVDFREGSLYVSATTRILRYDDIESRLENPPEPVVVTDVFPDAHHGWKFIKFGPDDKLYVPVGAPCNICNPGPKFAIITRMNPDGSGLETFVRGVRNTVGFDWHPKTGELWFTNNGRDWMGDNLPPEQLNHAPREGLNFGYPFCHSDIPDPEFGDGADCSKFAQPAQKLPAHVAPLGMRFYTGDMFPESYRSQIFIAEHGSWNSSVPVGYRITLARLEDNQVVSYEVFAEGWLRGGQAWGRPVDVLVMPDGALLVSDDAAGAIYRISYRRG